MLVELIYEKASPFERIFSFIMDIMAINVIQAALGLAGVKVGWLFLYLAYFICFEGILGKGLGKWAMGIEVVNSEGDPPGPVVSGLRVLLLPLSVITARPIHDSLTNTHVVKS